MRKRAFLFMVAMLGMAALHAQKVDSLSETASQQYLSYMKKRSTNNTFGWVLVGTGAALFGSTFLINNNNGWNGPTKNQDMFVVGIGAAALSIPFFIAASVNKRKADLVLKGERLSSTRMFPHSAYPAIAFRVNL